MVLLVLLRPAQTVSAHPVDMYAQDQSVSIGADGVQINWRIAPGPILADTVWEAAEPAFSHAPGQSQMPEFLGTAPRWGANVGRSNRSMENIL